MGDRQYNLDGLKRVFWGSLMFLVPSVLGQIGSRADGAIGALLSLISVIAFIAALVLIISGLSRIKEYSQYFHAAKRNFIVGMILTIVSTIIAVVGVVVMFGLVVAESESSVSSLDDVGALGAGLGAGFIAVVIGVILIMVGALFVLLYNRGVMFGCGEIAERCGDPVLGQKCRKLGNAYIIVELISVGVIILMLIFSGSSLLIAAAQEDSSALVAAASGSIILLLVLLALAIASLVIWILMLVRIYDIYNKYNGSYIGGVAPGYGYGAPGGVPMGDTGYGYGTPATSGTTEAAVPNQPVPPTNEATQNREQ